MTRRLTVALCIIFTACGPELDSNSVEGDSISSETTQQPIIGLALGSNAMAKGDFHVRNLGAPNTCAYFNGKYMNTQTCGTNLFSLYQIKANQRYMLCNPSTLVETRWTDTCTRYYINGGNLVDMQRVSCSLVQHSGACVNSGSGTDIRIDNTLIDANHQWQCSGSGFCTPVQYFIDGKIQFEEQLPTTTFAYESGVYLKTSAGKYLKRKSTNIVSAETLVATDANFKWTTY